MLLDRPCDRASTQVSQTLKPLASIQIHWTAYESIEWPTALQLFSRNFGLIFNCSQIVRRFNLYATLFRRRDLCKYLFFENLQSSSTLLISYITTNQVNASKVSTPRSLCQIKLIQQPEWIEHIETKLTVIV